MKKINDDAGKTCPVFVSRSVRLVVGGGVLGALFLLGTLVLASSEDAVDRKLAEFEAAPRVAQAARDRQAGQARVAAAALDRYHAGAATGGCERSARRPG